VSHQREISTTTQPTQPQAPATPPGELRDDPMTGRVVAIASGRAARPEAFLHEAAPMRGPAGCPFCTGNERLTPPELWADRDPGTGPDEPGWLVRVVPNLFPAFAGSPAPGHADATAGLYRAEPSYGAHEVIIHSPDHAAGLAELPEEDLVRVLATYRRRLAILRERGYGSVVVIVNQGKAAGASLEHAHSQVMATVRRGDLIQAEVDRLQTAACAACAVVEAERGGSADGRQIEEKDGLLTLCPWASSLPYEALLLPERHQGRFEEGGDDQDHALAGALGRLLRRLQGMLGAAVPYNLVLHSAPPGVEDFHWHLHLYPRLTTFGGFEWASGIIINVVDPDKAAAAYRGVSGP
jgi:UDPglucose--hexose-1-phosphate uridylyltransferase